MAEVADVAICFAVDCSSSVDFDEFGLMLEGYGWALAQPEVAEAIGAGPRGAAAFAVLFWSGPGTAEVMLPWTVVRPEGAAEFGARMAALPRSVPPGATALGEALGIAVSVTELARALAPRLVIDVSGDGRNNVGPPPAPERDRAVAAGITVNALAVLDEEPDLVAHYADEVIGGPGAFVMTAAVYADFAEAMLRKLLRELRGAPVV
jgi:hypothetical protein